MANKVSLDEIVSQTAAISRDWKATWSESWRGRWWVRELRWAFLGVVVLREWCGSRYQQSTTGRAVLVSLPRYWRLLWQLRKRGELPTARTVQRG